MTFDPVINDQLTTNKDFPASLRSLILKSDGCKLLSTLLLADGEGPHPTVLLLHGFPGNETNLDIAHAIRRMGWNVFLFHYRGTWGSEGNFSWSNAIYDVNVAVEFLRDPETQKNFRVDNNKIVIIGYSMGGFTGFMHAAKDKGINNVVSISAFNFGLAASMLPQVPNGKEMALEYLHLGVSFVNGTTEPALLDEMLKHADEFNLLNYVAEYASKNVLMLGATYDVTAPMDLHYYPLVKALQEAKVPNLQTHILETGHGFSTKRIELTRIIINWLKEIKF